MSTIVTIVKPLTSIRATFNPFKHGTWTYRKKYVIHYQPFDETSSQLMGFFQSDCWTYVLGIGPNGFLAHNILESERSISAWNNIHNYIMKAIAHPQWKKYGVDNVLTTPHYALRMKWQGVKERIEKRIKKGKSEDE